MGPFSICDKVLIVFFSSAVGSYIKILKFNLDHAVITLVEQFNCILTQRCFFMYIRLAAVHNHCDDTGVGDERLCGGHKCQRERKRS